MSSPRSLALDGDLTIAVVASLRETLLQHFAADAADAVTLDLRHIEACDSAGVQLLLAARHSLHAQGRSLQLLEPSAVVRQALRTYGLDDMTGSNATAGAGA